MTRMYFDRKEVRDLADLVNCYSGGEFESPFRSTVPLLALVRDESDVFAEILGQCALSEAAAFHFEFKVLSPKGRGKASHTDVMVCSAGQCMAIEAKWTEPAYQRVGDWLKASSGAGDAGKKNRGDVLGGWIELLQRMSTRTIAVDELKELTYQTVHRAASACALGTAPQLAYLQFRSASRTEGVSRDERLADLKSLRGVLGHGCVFPLRLVEVELEPTLEFEKLAMLPKGDETSLKVKNALISGRLFTFKGIDVHEAK